MGKDDFDESHCEVGTSRLVGLHLDDKRSMDRIDTKEL